MILIQAELLVIDYISYAQRNATHFWRARNQGFLCGSLGAEVYDKS